MRRSLSEGLQISGYMKGGDSAAFNIRRWCKVRSLSPPFSIERYPGCFRISCISFVTTRPPLPGSVDEDMVDSG
jgi:hypothetical protein